MTIVFFARGLNSICQIVNSPGAHLHSESSVSCILMRSRMSPVKFLKRQYLQEQLSGVQFIPWLHTRSRATSLRSVSTQVSGGEGQGKEGQPLKTNYRNLHFDGASIGKKDNLDMVDWQTLLNHVSPTTATR